MRLYEYQAKNVFEEHDVPVPEQELIDTPSEAVRVGKNIGFPVMLKAQVGVGSRGKVGGIQQVDSAEDAYQTAATLFDREIHGESANQILVEKQLEYDQELYTGITINKKTHKVDILVSEHGGVDIETTASERPEAITAISLSPNRTLRPHLARELVYSTNLSSQVAREMIQLLMKIYGIWKEYDLLEIEINPLMKTADGLIAADAVIRCDPNALFRNQICQSMENQQAESEVKKLVQKHGFDYIPLDGSVGIVGNGAGLVMSIVDMVDNKGGRPADFLDLKGNTGRERVKDALRLVFSNSAVEKAVVGIFGGMTQCDKVAEGIVDFIKSTTIEPDQLYVQLVGTNRARGESILAANNVESYQTLEQAISATIEV